MVRRDLYLWFFDSMYKARCTPINAEWVRTRGCSFALFPRDVGDLKGVYWSLRGTMHSNNGTLTGPTDLIAWDTSETHRIWQLNLTNSPLCDSLVFLVLSSMHSKELDNSNARIEIRQDKANFTFGNKILVIVVLLATAVLLTATQFSSRYFWRTGPREPIVIKNPAWILYDKVSPKTTRTMR